jgi:hypothetical protein
MNLLRLSEVQIGQNDRVCRHARWSASILWLAAFCADAPMSNAMADGKSPALGDQARACA